MLCSCCIIRSAVLPAGVIGLARVPSVAGCKDAEAGFASAGEGDGSPEAESAGRPLSATAPVTGATSSVTLSIAGANGATVSMVTWNGVEAARWLPAASVAFNGRV